MTRILFTLPLVTLASLAACGGNPVEPAAAATPSATASAAPVAPSATLAPSATVAPVATTTAPPDGPVPGGDRDAHGCIGSAGYTYSELRKECIRVFEKGVRLDPVPAVAGVVSAFVVFAGDDHAVAKNTTVEIFTPSDPASVILTRAKSGADYTKAGSPLTATFAKRWEIKKDGKTIYAESK